MCLQAQINALGVQLLEEPTAANEAGVQSLRTAAAPHVFDVSANSLSGPVPSFLYANNVPAFVRPNVNLRVRAGAPVHLRQGRRDERMLAAELTPELRAVLPAIPCPHPPCIAQLLGRP